MPATSKPSADNLMHIHRCFYIITLLITTSIVFIACESDDCTDDYKPGPIVVTVDCVEDARINADQLKNEPLVVEYQQDSDTWKPCSPYDVPNRPIQLCDENDPTSVQFECGDKPGTFSIRAQQGTRSAGPIEVTGEIKSGDWPSCAYFTDESLNYKLSLDAEE